MKNAWKLICIMLFVGANLFAQDKLTPELLWKMGRINDPQVSPDGKWIVFGITHYNIAENKGSSDLYLLSTEGGEPKKITDFEKNELSPRWRPDGKKIGFLATKDGAPQWWEMNPDGSDKKKLSNFPDGLSYFAYSPMLNNVYFTQEFKMEKTVKDIYPDLPKADALIIDELMFRHWDSWSDENYRHIVYAKYSDGWMDSNYTDIMKDEKDDSPMNPFGGPEELAWSADGKTIAYSCKKQRGIDYAVGTNSSIYLYNLESKQTTNITEGMMGYDKDPVFSNDGKMMAWMSMERDGFESDKNRIFVYDFITKKKEDLTANLDQSAIQLCWSKDNKKIYFLSGINATQQIFEVEVATKKIRQITNGMNDYTSVACAGNFLIAPKMSMSSPVEIFKVDIATGKETQLTFLNKLILEKMKMGKVEKRMVKTTDNKEMLVWVIYPPDFDATKKYPALLYCQGGPQSMLSQFFSYRWNFQLMAANGYIVVAPCRRGMPSFGKEWNDEISGDWGGQAMQDYLSAIDDVSKESYVDKNRLGCVGASYGGYSVYMLAGIHNKRFKTFIAHAGLFNLEGWYASTEEMFFANWDLKGAYWQNPRPKSYELFSPNKYIDKWDAPILVIHGEKDYRVPVTEGMQAFTAAKLRGIEAKFLYYPEEGHWILKPQNGLLWHRVFFDWLDKYLK